MKKFVKSSLVDQIFDYIQGEIIHGTWKPGEKLPSETELAASLEVSRMSLRSAIQRCCAMGLTETRTGEGTFVRNFSLRSYFSELYRMKLLGQQPNEINDLCAILQLGSARLAFASNVTPERYRNWSSWTRLWKALQMPTIRMHFMRQTSSFTVLSADWVTTIFCL